jgi:anti-sigma regulatory factor (Ser/Thr protein kinase)
MRAILTKSEPRHQHPTDTGEMHLALFYSGDAEYVDGVKSFVAGALDAGEPVAIAVAPSKSELLRDALGDHSELELLDMVELGRNPARIIPAVEGMLAKHDGRLLHYIGEPIWHGRSRDEVREATRHEALINLAWPGAHIRLLCPYDVDLLDPYVLVDAEKTHPHLIRDGQVVASRCYAGAELPIGCDDPLPEPPADATPLPFGLPNLYAVRSLVKWTANQAGMSAARIGDLVIAINELATNAIRHAHGGGLLRVWRTPGTVICQVEDTGQIHDPLAGRRAPAVDAEGGMGLWTVNQLCDLVEVRTTDTGTTIRVHHATSDAGQASAGAGVPASAG